MSSWKGRELKRGHSLRITVSSVVLLGASSWTEGPALVSWFVLFEWFTGSGSIGGFDGDNERAHSSGSSTCCGSAGGSQSTRCGGTIFRFGCWLSPVLTSAGG